MSRSFACFAVFFVCLYSLRSFFVCQLDSAAALAFEELARKTGATSTFRRADERSVRSLFFGEKDVIKHVEDSIGHSVYTADACHLHRPSIGYDCIAMVLSRRVGDGKVFFASHRITSLTLTRTLYVNRHLNSFSSPTFTGR